MKGSAKCGESKIWRAGLAHFDWLHLKKMAFGLCTLKICKEVVFIDI
jgi:hypothetical protein